MKSQLTQSQTFSLTWLRYLIVVVLVLGVFFRFVNLDRKVYWHDEVYTSLRAAGFTRAEIDRELFQNQMIAARELQKFQRLKPGSTPADTIHSLAIEDPQHPPFYFLMARFWMKAFGSSITASRTLPALLSLLALPLMYGLGLELFASPLAALLATVLLAVSPFDVLFAQTVRQYSLLTVMAIASSLFLLRALRWQNWQNWVPYSFTSVVGLYTHPFFGLTLIAQGACVLLLNLPFSFSNLETPRLEGWRQQFNSFLKYLLAVAGALVLYSPWLIVLKTNFQRMSGTTNWARDATDFLYLMKSWTLSFTSLFLDLDLGINSVWTYVLRLPIVVLGVVALYTICRQTSRTTWLFILTSIFVPFLMLALPDVLFGGKRSAVTRYLISCYPGVQLAVAYVLAHKLLLGQWLWRGVTALLVTGSIASCTVSAFSDTWWSKGISYFNAEVASVIHRDGISPVHTKPPLVLSDIGDDFTNTGDLISLSYQLRDNVQLLLLSPSPNLELLQSDSHLFAFRPSKRLYQALEDKQIQLEQVFQPGRLWRLQLKGGERSQTGQILRYSDIVPNSLRLTPF
ncbi:MAG: glycosyltransferase family 39 protein [Coleofasciculus sp. S288]|nr:glycosyltransferase family 39 protein [Coleofasciculus sp. S288]